MKRHKIQCLCIVIAIMLVFSALVIPTITARAASNFKHTLSSTATAAEKTYVQEIMAADSKCIYSYSASDFGRPMSQEGKDPVIADPNAYLGKAVEHKCSYNDGLSVIALSNRHEQDKIGVIPESSYIKDGNYHLYKLDDVVIVKDKPIRFVMLCPGWSIQLEYLPADLSHAPNAKVDLYISMKISGSASNWTYCFDRVIAVGPARESVQEVVANTATATVPPAPTIPADSIVTTEPSVTPEPTVAPVTSAPTEPDETTEATTVEVTEETTEETTAETTEETTAETTEETTESTEPSTTVDNETKPENPINGNGKTQKGTVVTVLSIVAAIVLLGGAGAGYYLLRLDKKKIAMIVGLSAGGVLAALVIALVVCAAIVGTTATIVLSIISGVVLLGGAGAGYYLLRLDKKKIAMIASASAGAVLVALLIALIVCAAINNTKPVDVTTEPTGTETTEQTDGTTGETTDDTTGESVEDTTADPTEDTTADPTEDTTADSAEGTAPTTEPLPDPTFPTETTPVPVKTHLDLGQMTIVLPANATDVEKTAAKELTNYVNKMTGETLTTVTEGTAVNAGIYVGATTFAKNNNVKYPSTEYGEGWAIQVIGNNLVLCGEATRGTLYAVFHLLEDVLGVHWWTYTEEYVPNVEKAVVPLDYLASGAPAFKYRDIHPGNLYQTENLFMVRNRVNGMFSNPRDGYGKEEIFGQPSYVHSFAYYVPNSMFNEHPEWFSLIGGKRTQSSQLCMTNQQLITYMTNKVVEYIEKDIQASQRYGVARPRWYSLSPNDYAKFCECEGCKAAMKKSGMSGYLLQFINQIAAGVGAKYPDVLIDTLAYWHYIVPPTDDTKPAKNVQIRFADNYMDVNHSFAHINNEKAMEYLKKWAAITEEGQLFVWDYVVHYYIDGVSPTMYKYQEHFQTLLELGVTGYFGEQEGPINTDFWDLKLWLNAKLMEDPYQNFDALLDTFLNGYYGAGGPYVRRYLDMVGGLLEDSNIYGAFNQRTLSPSWLTYDVVIAADTYFDMAFDAVKGDETLLRRLRLARNGLDRAILERFEDYQEAAQSAGKSFNFNKKALCQSIIDCLNEQFDLRRNVDDNVQETLLPYYTNILNSLS